MPPDLTERLVPTPVGFSSEVKRKAARAERAWEAAAALIGTASATGTAAIAAGIAIPPIAPFLGLVAGGSVWLKLRAKWVKDDPPRADFHVRTPFAPPRIDLMPVMPPEGPPPGAGIPALLHATGASIEATVVCVERASGAAEAARGNAGDAVRATLGERIREAYGHASRTEMLTESLAAALPEMQEVLPGYRSYDVLWEDWDTRYARKTLAELHDARTLGALIAAGLDERVLAFEIPSRFRLDGESYRGDGESPDHGPAPPGDVVEEAAASAAELGASLRQWAWEATLHPSLGGG